MVGGVRLLEGDPRLPARSRSSGLGRHEIERPRRTKRRVAIASVGQPDAGTMHRDLAVDQSGRRFGMVDADTAPVPGSQDRSRMAKRQQLAA